MFLEKLLKKHLGLLRKYTYVRRIKRNIRQIQDNRVLKSGWNKLRFNALRHSKIKQFEIGRTALSLTNIMHEWRRAIRRKSVLKDYQCQFKRWREERQKLQIVKHF